MTHQFAVRIAGGGMQIDARAQTSVRNADEMAAMRCYH
jgi:hypothetical protein